MKINAPVVLAVLVAPICAEVSSNGLLRHHRNLPSCAKKNKPCDDAHKCCGAASRVACEGVCCLLAAASGCETADDCCAGLRCFDSTCCLSAGGTCSANEDCCPDEGLECDLTTGLCKASEASLPPDEHRTCGIHGEVCEVLEGEASDVNDCCGDVKYNCENIDHPDRGVGLACCIPLGGKGCSYTYHCCGSLDGNYCDPDSRCVDPVGNFPTDAPGLPDCENKGGPCDTVEEDCCGDVRLGCETYPDSGDLKRCCVLSGVSGCYTNDDCCSDNCDFVFQTCCTVNGNACEWSGECCSYYCEGGQCKDVPTIN